MQLADGRTFTGPNYFNDSLMGLLRSPETFAAPLGYLLPKNDELWLHNHLMNTANASLFRYLEFTTYRYYLLTA